MKTKEEIDELYHKLYTISIDGEDNLHYYSFVDGYTQCQEDMADKKYTLKQVERYHDIRATQGIKNANKYINSLNKQDK